MDITSEKLPNQYLDVVMNLFSSTAARMRPANTKYKIAKPMICESKCKLEKLKQIWYMLPTICNTYSTVGRSIADIQDRGAYIFTEAQSTEVNMSTKVLYRGYRPTYCTICDI